LHFATLPLGLDQCVRGVGKQTIDSNLQLHQDHRA